MIPISGVRVRELVAHSDVRGSLTEILRSDWPEFGRFGQAIVTVNRPGVIRAWHWHDRQSDVIVVLQGRVLLPLYDGRPGSDTRGSSWQRISEEGQLFALFVPPGVYHGYKTVGPRDALIVNVPTDVYDASAPDEHRVPHDDPTIGFDWDQS